MSRADRNNNPGNLRPGSGRVLWDGQTGTDPDGFAVFGSRDAGLSAARKQVMLDYTQHGLKTPAQLAAKYTKTDQTVYAKRLAGALGIGVNDDARLDDPNHFALYMGQLYGNEDAHASSVQDPGKEFAGVANLSSGASAPDSSGGDFEKAASIAPSPAPDHLDAATGSDPFSQALGAPDQPHLDDAAVADLTKIHKAGGGVAEVMHYLTTRGLSADPAQVKAAVASWDKGGPVVVVQHPAQAQSGQIVAPPAEQPGTLESLAAGFGQGVRDVGASLHNFATWADNKIPVLGALDQAGEHYLGIRTPNKSQAIDQANLAAYNQGYGGNTAAGVGRITGNLVTALPAIAATEGAAAPILGDIPGAAFLAGRGGANLLTRGASLAVRGGTGGAEFAGLTSGGSNQPFATQVAHGAEMGALMAPALGSLAFGGNKLLGSAAISPERAALAQQAVQMGIPVRASQLSPGSTVNAFDSLLGKIPGSGMADSNALQRQAFTRAISNTFGEDAPALTEEVMSRAKTNIGNRIGDIAARNTITDTSGLINDLADIEHNASGVLENTKPIHNQISNILDKVTPDGALPGESYQALIRKGGPLDALMSSGDPAKVKIAGDIRDALDDAFQSSVSPQDAQAFRDARLQYKNLMTVKGLAAKAPEGQISPSLLQHAVTSSFKDRAFSGAGDLGTLGNIGQTFLKPAPSSGTAENSAILQGLFNAGKYAAGAGAGVLGIHAGLPPVEAVAGGMGSAAGAAALARLATKALTNPARANKLIDAALDNGTAPITVPSLVRIGVPIGAVESNRLRQLAPTK